MTDKTEEAKLLLETEKQERIKRAGEAIAKILEKENCTLDVSVTLRVGQVIPQIAIITK